MPKKSAGILVYRGSMELLEVFLVHPGGPFWSKKDEGAWTIPKGEILVDEEPLEAAKREFHEETGQIINGHFFDLGSIKQKSGKVVIAWGVCANPDAERISSNTVKIEWPYCSGKWQFFPEIDKAAWFTINIAKLKINAAQVALLNQLIIRLETKQ